MSLVAVLEALESEGVDAKTMLAVVRAHETARLAEVEAKRAKAAEKKRRQRAAPSPNVPGTNGDTRGQTGTGGDGEGQTGTGDARLTCERTQVVIPSLPSLRSEEVVVVDAERERAAQSDDWPKGNGPTLAKLLIAEVGSHWLDLDRSGGLNTSTGRFLVWKRQGASWVHDVVPVITTVCARRKTRVNSWQFFDEAIAASIAANRAALEIPEAGSVVPFRNTGPPKTSRAERNEEGWEYAIARIAADE